MHDEEDESLYEELERRALFDLPEDDEDAAPDVIGALRAGEAAASAQDAAQQAPDALTPPSRDVTLGGYIEEHNRVPAFEGLDGQPYTVDIDTEQANDGAFVAFLIFIRWAATGAGIMDHVESGDVATGATADAARQAAMDLSLYEIRAELDAAITRRREALED